jgi:hypothetical protein
MHMAHKALLEGFSDIVVELDAPTHTHIKNITYTQHNPISTPMEKNLKLTSK